MIRNMGAADRTLRVILGLAAVAALFGWGWSLFGGIIGSVLVAVAVIMFVTAAIGYCPTYSLLGVSTNPTAHRVAWSRPKLAAHH